MYALVPIRCSELAGHIVAICVNGESKVTCVNITTRGLNPAFRARRLKYLPLDHIVGLIAIKKTALESGIACKQINFFKNNFDNPFLIVTRENKMQYARLFCQNA